MGVSRKRAQSIAEYAILLALVSSIFLGMQVYVKRGMQGRLKDASDSIVNTLNHKLGYNYEKQYVPDYRKSTKDTTQDSLSREQMQEGGVIIRDSTDTSEYTYNEVVK